MKELQTKLEQNEKVVHNLEQELQMVEQKSQQNFEKEKKNMIMRMNQLTKENESLQSDYRELKK